MGGGAGEVLQRLELAEEVVRDAALGRAGDVLRKLDLGARVNEPLIAALVARLSCEDGAILIFVPGVREIDSLCAALERQPKCVVVPLHGRLSVAEQSRAFRPAPAGRTKVVVATDVAEASVTIPDCTNVIDCGLARSVVGEAWSARAARRVVTGRVSADAAKQRAGRAGRVRAGTCWRLWCAVEQDALETARPPEMATLPLCGVALRAKSLFGGAVAPGPASRAPRGPSRSHRPPRTVRRGTEAAGKAVREDGQARVRGRRLRDSSSARSAATGSGRDLRHRRERLPTSHGRRWIPDRLRNRGRRRPYPPRRGDRT